MEVQPNKEFTTGGQLEDFLDRLADVPTPNRYEDFEELLTLIKRDADSGSRDWVEELGITSEGLYGGGDADFYYEMLIGWLDGVLGGVHQWVGDEPFKRSPYQVMADRHRAEAALKVLAVEFVGVVTTNYDLVPESLAGRRPIDYGFRPGGFEYVTRLSLQNEGRFNQYTRVASEARETSPAALKVLKIHGNQNSAYCRDCEKLLIYEEQPSFDFIRGSVIEDAVRSDYAWAQTTAFTYSFHCGDPGEESPGRSAVSMRPLILPPLREKRGLTDWRILRPVVEGAHELADDADKDAVVGTAVRPSDEDLRAVLYRLDGKPIVYIGGEDGLSNLRSLVPRSEIEVLARRLTDLAPAPVSE